MPEGYAPSLGAGLSLLNLFGLTSISAKIFGTLIIALIFASLFIRFRYPCRSPSSLIKVVDQAKTLFNKCLATRAFDVDGEYDKFKKSLRQISARALGIASRTHDNLNRRSSTYFEKILFWWRGLKEIVDCHRKAQLLIRDLEMCLMRASLALAEYELQRTRTNPQALYDAGSGYSVEALV
ncbi:hypothetical protein E1B28_000310 [Marasmius oreades]|uniref:Uncharacterized protein n=1 Tax=Marasmius oreades TaxID=181124 RepID=A0A9P8AE00_9AGAR|nr:uncharacterized protein E1B28_000310 [Marasmius oreades]KAG7098351.1 hypothetical protein E1B28_000310 [Marasmius oreades]